MADKSVSFCTFYRSLALVLVLVLCVTHRGWAMCFKTTRWCVKTYSICNHSIVLSFLLRYSRWNVCTRGLDTAPCRPSTPRTRSSSPRTRPARRRTGTSCAGRRTWPFGKKKHTHTHSKWMKTCFSICTVH